MTTTAKQKGLIIINKSGYFGGGMVRTKPIKNNNDDEDDEDDEDNSGLEPLLPYGIDPTSKREIKEGAFEPLYPIGFGQEN